MTNYKLPPRIPICINYCTPGSMTDQSHSQPVALKVVLLWIDFNFRICSCANIDSELFPLLVHKVILFRCPGNFHLASRSLLFTGPGHSQSVCRQMWFGYHLLHTQTKRPRMVNFCQIFVVIISTSISGNVAKCSQATPPKPISLTMLYVDLLLQPVLPYKSYTTRNGNE